MISIWDVHTIYKNWNVHGSDNWWSAIRWGVRMTANSLELIRTMIDLREADPANRMIPC